MDPTNRLAAARARAAEKEAAEVRLRRVQEQIRARRTSLQELDAALRDEEQDVRRLEGLGLTALFSAMLGTKEERLSKERAEALRARLSRDACREALDGLLADERTLQAKAAESGDAYVELAEALRLREAELVASGAPEARRLAEIDASIADAKAVGKELDEARVAGDVALRSLDGVMDALDSARNWGTWDMLGGGMLATYAKHSRIDDARGAAHAAQRALDRFAREMADVRGLDAGRLVVEIGGFSKFADYFFDGLIADWIVQDRIADSRRNVEDARRQVRDAQRALGERDGEVRRAMQTFADERRRVVEGA
jgi:hypothetical protein